MPSSACIVTRDRIDRHGYGVGRLDGKQTGSHRVAWVKAHGPIPAGAYVLHSCDNRACVNVEHLRLGTAQDNSDDAVRRGRMRRGEASPNAVLTEELVLLIRSSSESQERLANRLGITQGQVSRIRAGKAWRHLLEPAARR